LKSNISYLQRGFTPNEHFVELFIGRMLRSNISLDRRVHEMVDTPSQNERWKGEGGVFVSSFAFSLYA